MTNLKNREILKHEKERYENDFVLTCDCSDFSHIAGLSIDSNNSDSCIFGFLHIHLNYQPRFFRRLIIAFLYIFKKKSKFYDYDDVVLTQYQLKKLADFINKKVGRK